MPCPPSRASPAWLSLQSQPRPRLQPWPDSSPHLLRPRPFALYLSAILPPHASISPPHASPWPPVIHRRCIIRARDGRFATEHMRETARIVSRNYRINARRSWIFYKSGVPCPPSRASPACPRLQPWPVSSLHLLRPRSFALYLSAILPPHASISPPHASPWPPVIHRRCIVRTRDGRFATEHMRETASIVSRNHRINARRSWKF